MNTTPDTTTPTPKGGVDEDAVTDTAGDGDAPSVATSAPRR